MEARRRHANDGERVLVELNDAAHHRAIFLKVAVPERPGEHHVWGAIGAMLIGAREKTAQIRVKPEHVEVISSGCIASGTDRIAARVQAREDHLEGSQILEAVIAISQVEVVGIRLETRIGPVLRPIKALRLRYIQQTQHQAIHNAEHHGVGPDRQRQRRHGGHQETGRFPQDAQAIADILDESLDEIAAERFVGFLFMLLISAEFDASAAFRLGRREAGPLEVIAAELDVRTEFFLQLDGGPGT